MTRKSFNYLLWESREVIIKHWFMTRLILYWGTFEYYGILDILLYQNNLNKRWISLDLQPCWISVACYWRSLTFYNCGPGPTAKSKLKKIQQGPLQEIRTQPISWDVGWWPWFRRRCGGDLDGNPILLSESK